jgi:hypothetical protein
MSRLKNPLRIVAVVLIVVAAISGYGLYQTMYNWAQAQDAKLNCSAAITHVNLKFIEGGHAVISVDYLVDNPAKISVQIVEITFYAYAGQDLFSQSNLIGLGTHSFLDSPELGQVEPESQKPLTTSLGIQKDSLNMDILKASFNNGTYPVQLRSVIRFQLVDFPDIYDKMFPGVWVGELDAS